MKDVLILGGTGLMGRRVAQLFHAAGWAVTACGRSGCRRLPIDPGCEPCHAPSLLRGRSWDIVVDFRALTPADVVMVIEPCTPRVGVWCHISTIYVYGNPKAAPPGSHCLAGLTEDSPLNPVGPYGTSKLQVEMALNSAFTTTDTRLVVCRLPFIFGRHDRSGRAESLLEQLRSPGLLVPADDGHEIDLIHASTVAPHIFMIATHRSAVGTYNVTTPPAHRVGTHLRTLAEAAHIDITHATHASHLKGVPFVFDVPYYLDPTRLTFLDLPPMNTDSLAEQWAEAISDIA